MVYRLTVTGFLTRMTRSTALPSRQRPHHRPPWQQTLAVIGTTSFSTTSRSRARNLMPVSSAPVVLGSSNKFKVCEGNSSPPGARQLNSAHLSMQRLTLYLNPGCGYLTEWSFEPRTADPQGYQWFAKRNMPIGTKACVGRAVVSASEAFSNDCMSVVR
jgi:hypothetical protein